MRICPSTLLLLLASLQLALASIRQNLSEGLARNIERVKRTLSPLINNNPITSRSSDLGAYMVYLKKCSKGDTTLEDLDYNADEYQSEECVKRAIDAGNERLVKALLSHDYRGQSYAQGIVNYAALHDNVTMLTGILRELQHGNRNYQVLARNAMGLARRAETKEYLDKFAEI